MQGFSNEQIDELKSRIDQIHDLLATRGNDAVARDRQAAALRPQLIDQLTLSIQIRRIRRHHFGDVMMAGPTWDMMLDLMLANANGRMLSASDLATGAGVPLSSGLRLIGALEEAGLVKRSIDERDRRRTIVRLTDAGTDRMATYFERVSAALTSQRNLVA